MDFMWRLTVLASTVLILFQNTLALSPRHFRSRKLIRLLDNAVANNNNRSKTLTVDGAGISVRTTNRSPIRLYIEILDSRMPLTILVEPQCGVLTRWKVHLLEQTSSDDSRKVIDLVHPQTKRKSYVKIIDTLGTGLDTELAEYSSREFVKFRLGAAPSGVYMINLVTESEGWTKIAAAQEKEIQVQYPVMPSDRKVALAKVSETTFMLSWKKATMESETKNSAGKMRYCVLVTKRGAVSNFCTALSLLKASKDDVFQFECFYGRSYFFLSKPLFGMAKFYASVFAIHPYSNKTLAYDSVALSPSHRAEERVLKDSSIVNGKIRRGKGYNVFHYENSFPADIKFSLVACDSPVTFCLAFNDKVVRCQEISQAVDTFVVRRAAAGKYIITLTASKKKSTQFRLFATSLGHRQPFPNLPPGRVIREWPLLRTCNSVTLAWIGVHGKQQYCLFIKRVGSTDSFRKKGLCARAQDSPATENVSCIYKRLRKREKMVFTKTIKNLQPCTKYEFVVQVKKIRAAEALMYKPIRVVTKCTKC